MKSNEQEHRINQLEGFLEEINIENYNLKQKNKELSEDLDLNISQVEKLKEMYSILEKEKIISIEKVFIIIY